MTCKLIHKLKQKPQQTDKLIFVTQYTDNIQRIKRIFNKHWELIKNNHYLKHINQPQPLYQYCQQHHNHKSNQIISSIYFKTPRKILETLSNNATKNANYANN